MRHYRNVYASSAADPPVSSCQELPLVFARKGNREFVQDLVFMHPAEAIRLKQSRRPGPVNSSFELIMTLSTEQREQLRTRSLLDDCVPRSWKWVPATALAKPGKRSLTANRLIVSLAGTHKWYLRSISMQLFEIVHSRLLPNFLGVRKGDNVLFMTTYASLTMSKLTEWGLSGYLLKVDISKAFATVPHYEVIAACEFLGVPVGWCHAVEAEIRDNYLLVSYNGLFLGVVGMFRGIVEGSPLSPLLFGIWSNYNMHKLLAHPQFISSQLVLPAAANHGHLRLIPLAFFDDWLIPCQDVPAVQTVIDVFGGLLAVQDMSLANEPGKLEFIGRGTFGASVYCGDRQIVQLPSMIILGAKIDSAGNAYTALEHRNAVAHANWTRFKKAVNINHLNIANHCKAIDAVFAASLIHGMAGFPFDVSLASKVQSYVGRVGISCVKLKPSEAPTIEIAFLRRREAFKRLKRSCTLCNPLRRIAAQRLGLQKLPSYLQALVEYRTLSWARSLTLASRPPRTRGGIILDLGEQLEAERLDLEMSKFFAVNALIIRYGHAGLWH